MWDRLARQVQVEFEQLERLLATHRTLLERSEMDEPHGIELSALAAMLHSFYTGVENLFKRVAVEIDGHVPEGDLWHRALLDQMAAPTGQRPPVISAELRDALHQYLGFRHVFRQAYTFDLRWEKMRGLVLNCSSALRDVREALDALLARGPGESP